MKVKLNTILAANAIFKSIIDNDADKSIDSITKFRLLTMLKEMRNAVSTFEEVRYAKIREYGTINTETGNYEIDEKSDNFKKLSEDIARLVEEDVDVNVKKIKIDDAIALGLNSDSMLALYDMIEA